MRALLRLTLLLCLALLAPAPAWPADDSNSHSSSSQEFTGRTEAVQTVQVVPLVTATVEKILFKPGTVVTAGTPLFDLDSRSYQTALEEAEAEVQRAEAVVTRTRNVLVQARKALAQRTLDQSTYDANVADVAAAEAGLRVAKIKVQQAQLQLDRTHIRAPITGRVDRPLVSVGELASSDPVRLTLLTTIVSTDPMAVYFPVPEDLLPRLADQVGKLPVHIGLGSSKEFPLQGTLDYLANRADPKTKTIMARAVFATKDRDVRPEMSARVRLSLGEAEKGSPAQAAPAKKEAP
jgi:gold/copper resistance efflux system membrane fusion protein